MKYIIKFVMFVAAFAVAFSGLTFVATPVANADTTDNQCLTTGSASNSEVKMEACAYDETSQKIDVSLTDRTTASGKVQLSYFNPNAKTWSLAAAKKCKLIYVSISWSATKIRRVVNANKRKVNSTWCVRLKHGSTWANSGKNGDRAVPFTATVRRSWSLMTLKNVSKGIWGHKGEYGGGRFWQVCDNEWKIGLKPTLKDTQVLMVRSEADVVYRNKVDLASYGAVKVEGSLNCPAGTLYGRAEAGASAATSLWIYVRASSAASARIEAARQAKANTAAWAQLRVKAQMSQEVTAHASIHLKCSDNPPPSDEAPSLDAQAAVCTTPDGVDDEITASGTNNDAVTRTLVFSLSGGPTSKPNITRTVGAGSTATVKWTGLNLGNYVVTVTVSETGLSDSESETLVACPPPPDNSPSMQCQAPQHIFVGDDSMYADFDLTDPDGDPVSFGEPVVTGPLQIVLVEDSTISGGKRRTVGIRAGNIPDGTSQDATLKVTGTAGGKSVSCTVYVTVENSNTGW